MATRQIKKLDKIEFEPEERVSQRAQPETGRFVLQVDRQTKSSHPTAEIAHAAGLLIKNNYPLLHVTVYDSVEHAGTTIVVTETGSAGKPETSH
jgi:hypothetical protein